MNISHDFPLPRRPDIRCRCGHVTKAVCESPILCHKCNKPDVVWVYPPAIKISMRVGVAFRLARA